MEAGAMVAVAWEAVAKHEVFQVGMVAVVTAVVAMAKVRVALVMVVVMPAMAAVEKAAAVMAKEVKEMVGEAKVMVVEEKVRVTMVVARVAVPAEKVVAMRQTARAQQRSCSRNPVQPATRSRKVGRRCRRTTPCTVLAQVTHRSLFRQCI